MLIEEDQQRLTTFAINAIPIAIMVSQFLENETDAIIGAMAGDADDVANLGHQMYLVADVLAEIIDVIRAEVMAATPGEAGYASGWLMGRIAGEVIVEVVQATSGGTLNAVTRSARLTAAATRISTKLNALPSIPGISPQAIQAVAAKLDAWIGFILANPKQYNHRAIAIVRRIKQVNGIDDWDALTLALEQTDDVARRTTFDQGMVEVVDSVMENTYKNALLPDGDIDLSKIKTCGEIKGYMDVPPGNRLKGHGLEIHHVFPVHLCRILLKNHPDYQGLVTDAQWRAALSDMPGLLVHVREHRVGKGLSNFHNILNNKLKNVNLVDPNPGEVLQAVEEAYNDWRPETGSALTAAASKWFTQKLSEIE